MMAAINSSLRDIQRNKDLCDLLRTVRVLDFKVNKNLKGIETPTQSEFLMKRK